MKKAIVYIFLLVTIVGKGQGEIPKYSLQIIKPPILSMTLSNDSSISIGDSIGFSWWKEKRKIAYIFVKDTSMIVLGKVGETKYPLYNIDEAPLKYMPMLVIMFDDGTWKDAGLFQWAIEIDKIRNK